MKNDYKETIIHLRLFRPIFHILIIMLIYLFVYQIRFYTDLIPFVQLRIPYIDSIETFVFASLSSLTFVVLGIMYGVYELFRPIHGYYKKFMTTWVIWLMVTSFVAYFGYGFLFVSGISRFILFWGAFFSWFAISLFDIVYNNINSILEKKHPYKILFVYSNKKLFQKTLKNFDRYAIYDIHGEHIDDLIEYIGAGDDLKPKLKTGLHLSRYDIIVSIGNIDYKILQVIVDKARILGISFYNIGESHFLEDLIHQPSRLGPLFAFEYKPSPLDGWYRVVKRFFDIFVSAFGLIFLSPVLLLISILIKLDSKGPVIYSHKRVGKNGQLIDFIKFRSMYTHMSVGDNYGGKDAASLYENLKSSDANKRKGPLAKIEDDPRITRVGKFLRKTSLDELPQLWIVLKGDMSIVGPRAHMPDEVAQYESWHKRLLSVKPGITGYAQIFGRDRLDFNEEAKLDIYYIQNRSLFLDLYVMITTFKVVFSGR